MLRHCTKRKKARGMLDDFLPIIIFVMACAILMLSYVNFNTAVNKKISLNSISRDYMLKIESKGYLTAEDKDKLIVDLRNAGFYADVDKAQISSTNIDSCLKRTLSNGTVEGTTLSDVGYGNDVTLTIQVYTDVSMLTDANAFAPKFGEETHSISTSLKSTSKE